MSPVVLFVISALTLLLNANLGLAGILDGILYADADLSTFDITKGGAYRAYGKTAIRFIYPNKLPANDSDDAFFAIDPVGKRMRFSQGKYGSVYVRPTPPSYATYPLPTGGLICGTINASWDLQVKELSLLTQKGQFRNKGLLTLLTDYSGFASEVAQCGQGIHLGFKTDPDNRVRFVSADTPFSPVGVGQITLSQYLDLPVVIPGIDESLFALDPSCAQPIPWCNFMLPGGPFALFNISYFNSSAFHF